jgi:hypothetical protein
MEFGRKPPAARSRGGFSLSLLEFRRYHGCCQTTPESVN